MWLEKVQNALRRVPVALVWVLALLGPLGWLGWLTIQGRLGVDPVKTIELKLGLWALQFLLASLWVTPLRALTGLNLLRFRRVLGVSAFAYMALHFVAWAVLDMGLRMEEVTAALVKHPYIILGMGGLALCLPLAVTSNNWSIRVLGPLRWRNLHRLAYLAALLAAAHFIILVKGWQSEPLIYGALFGLALVLRLPPMRRASGWVRAALIK